MPDFFEAIRDFLLDYLPKQRCFSPNTALSYKQTLKLFVRYLQDTEGLRLKEIKFSTINKNHLTGFLDWLVLTRNCSGNTRNQRLMALRSFLEYAGQRDVAQMGLYTAALAIPKQEYYTKVVEYLTEPALKTLLEQPDASKEKEFRNLVFMILMYDTGARCHEMLAIKICDLKINNASPIAFLNGKGKKQRCVPLMPTTVNYLKKYLEHFHPGEKSNSNKNVFYTVSHYQQHEMSSDNVGKFIDHYGRMAATVCPEIPSKVKPHMLRHTRAMHLYKHGMPLPLLADFLGHSSTETTRIYAYADTEMKREALNKADIVRQNNPIPIKTWDMDEELILKLSGLS